MRQSAAPAGATVTMTLALDQGVSFTPLQPPPQALTLALAFSYLQ